MENFVLREVQMPFAPASAYAATWAFFPSSTNIPSTAQPQLGEEACSEAEGWAYRWLTHEQNRHRLNSWDHRSDILNILSPQDAQNIIDCDTWVLNIVRGTLEHWYHQHYHSPSALQSDHAHIDAPASSLDGARSSLPSRASDDSDISLDTPRSSSIAPSGHTRRRSNSISLPPDNVPQDNSSFVYTRNQSVAITDGTDTSAVQRPPFVPTPTETTVSAPPKSKGHHHSKSGPVPAISRGRSLATRGAGVEVAGPSRLPSISQRPAEPTGGTPPPHGHQASVSASTNGNGISSQSSQNGSQAAGGNAGRRIWHSPADCLNKHVVMHNPPEMFAPCPCERCVLKSRTVHVGPIRVGEVYQRDTVAAVTDYFGQWGHVEKCELKKSGKNIHYALVRFVSEDSTHLAVRRSKAIVCNHPQLFSAKVSYPFFSKWYRYRDQPPRESKVSHLAPGNGSSSSGGVGNPSSTRTTPVRNPPQQALDRSPATTGGTRAQSMMQTKPPSENAVFQDGTAHPEGTTSIRVRIPETSAGSPPDSASILPRGKRLGMGSPVRRITFGDMPPELAREEPEEPTTTIPDHTTIGLTTTTPDIVPPPPLAPARHPAPKPVHLPRRGHDLGNRIPTLADDWAPPANHHIHHPPREQPGALHRDSVPFLRQLEDMDRLRGARQSGDVRLEPDFSGTVMIRRRRLPHGRFPSWLAPAPTLPPAPVFHPVAHPAPQPRVCSPAPAPADAPVDAPLTPSRPPKPTKQRCGGSRAVAVADAPPAPAAGGVVTTTTARPHTPTTPSGGSGSSSDRVADGDLYHATPPRRDWKGKGKEKVVAGVGGVAGAGAGDKKEAGERKKGGKGKRKGGKAAAAAVVEKSVVGVEAKGVAAEGKGQAGETKVDTAKVQHDAGLGKEVAASDNKGTVADYKKDAIAANNKNPTIDQHPADDNQKNDARDPSYRADAGGSLRIQRQRIKKKTARGSVRDLFNDQDQARQE
ncbi:hypothetical protein B0I37DRAFT_422836 [Chaetomium sp. MPI-CAGE-AT-0009]|nr:hypothetical protein B0I37DRAFT_422836 [Chaetomium sp. MPI-CAGE-AT-0009]